MNILIVNLDKAIFGPGSKSLEDLKDYSKKVGKIFVITWTLKKEHPIFFENKLFVYPTNSKNKLSYFFDTYKIFKEKILKENIDVISSQDPFETGLAAWVISLVFKIPLNIQVHVDFLSKYFWEESFTNKIRVFLGKFLVSRARRVRVVSERVKKSLLVINPRLSADITVLPIFVDVKKIKNASIKINLHKKYPQFDFIVLMASRFSCEKNILLAISAIKKIAVTHPQIGLIIVGDGTERESLMIARSHFLNVVIEPWSEDLTSYYKTADLFLLTSNYEGYGRTIIEAVASGCPVLTTDVGLAGELIKNNYNGFVVPVGGVDEVAFCIKKIISDKGMRQNLINSATHALDNHLPKEYFDREKYLKKLKEIWQKTLEK